MPDPGTRHNPQPEGPGQPSRDVRAITADLEIVDQGRATVDGATTIANDGGSGSPRVVQIWQDADADDVHIAVDEAPTTDHPLLENSTTWREVTTQEVNLIDTGNAPKVNYQVWEVVD